MGVITSEMVKQLRDKTAAGMMACKQALDQCDGDMEKAVDFLRAKGLATARKRSDRSTSEGIIHSYIHMGGKIGVMVEVNCESDFVAKTDDFIQFTKNVALHIAASNPLAIQPEDIPEPVVTREKQIYWEQAKDLGKPEKMMEKIVEGKLSKFLKESSLMNQPYVRDPNITIADLLNETIAKIGENIRIRRFVRFQLGE
ncbi:MAG: translation elongation factor Ts [Desulfobacterales bacterium]|nr:translation elongation factor Ts [Desulfobacterales bacterium]